MFQGWRGTFARFLGDFDYLTVHKKKFVKYLLFRKLFVYLHIFNN
jgi:hypothetical protein